MIYSMTAFARQEIAQEWGTAVWEIRSVNQRYLETFFRMPEQFRGLENKLREKVRSRLTRGKIECFLRFDSSTATNTEILLNKELAKQVVNSLYWLREQAGNFGEINLVDVLRYPGVAQPAEIDLDAASQKLMSSFSEVLESLIMMRAQEGTKIKELLTDRLNSIDVQVEKVRQQMPEILKWQRERILQRFEEVKIQVDNLRLEQELTFLAQRIDVAEELDRLNLHVKETKAILEKGGTVGRKLDFMMQELNREANTLASKSINNEITNAAVQLKVLIEQMREQIQNIE